MRSLFSGVSGLNNHQTRMDVIGNNIGNVNTTGFKRGRANFQDILSQTLSGAARPTADKGGVNPKQVGLGMTVAAIDTLHTQGAVQTTGVNTDIAVLGEGFFIERAGSSTVYSRNGAFSLDRDGFLVNPANGFKVQGFGTMTASDGSTGINTQGGLQDLKIAIGEKDAAKATRIIKYQSNLNAMTPLIPEGANEIRTAEGTWRTSIEAVDSKGNKQEVQLNFRKSRDDAGAEIPNQWTVEAAVIDLQGRPIQNLLTKADPAKQADTVNPAQNSVFYVTFNPAGSLVGIDDVQPPAGPYTAKEGALSLQLQYAIAGSENMDIRIDLGTAGFYDGITQFDAKSSTKAVFQDGQDMGYLQGFKIDDTGVITGTFSNGTNRPMGRLALANFTNPGGLEKLGESFYTETNNSGRALINAPGEQVAGSVKAGALEMSNVDLAEEFTQMIVTQRGFQANSRTITTSDNMLEELLRLKR